MLSRAAATALALLGATTLSHPAMARHHATRVAYHHHHHHGSYARGERSYGRPRAWCGWEMRHLVGADPGPSFNLARNWAHWGRPGPVGIGAVVVYPHHVAKVVGACNGSTCLMQSGNDGHAVRTRPRSIRGAIAIRWG
jgi:hypothetical protein